jgi:hypothetical protein
MMRYFIVFTKSMIFTDFVKGNQQPSKSQKEEILLAIAQKLEQGRPSFKELLGDIGWNDLKKTASRVSGALVDLPKEGADLVQDGA